MAISLASPASASPTNCQTVGKSTVCGQGSVNNPNQSTLGRSAQSDPVSLPGPDAQSPGLAAEPPEAQPAEQPAQSEQSGESTDQSTETQAPAPIESCTNAYGAYQRC